MKTKYYILDADKEPVAASREEWKRWHDSTQPGRETIFETHLRGAGGDLALITTFRSALRYPEGFDSAGAPVCWCLQLRTVDPMHSVWKRCFTGARSVAENTHKVWVEHLTDAYELAVFNGGYGPARELAPPTPERDDSQDLRPCLDEVTRRIFVIQNVTGNCWIAFDRADANGKVELAWVCTDTCACLKSSALVGMTSDRVMWHFSSRSFGDVMQVPAHLAYNFRVVENTWLAEGEEDYNRFVADLPHLQK